MAALELPLLGGALIGLAAVLLMAALGEVAGISGIVMALLPPSRTGAGWRLPFLVGLLLGPMLAAWAVGRGLIAPPTGSAALMLAAGVLVGVGAGMARGCTSGHGVCGIARLSVRSLSATGAFMATAVATVFLVRHVL